VADQPPSTDRLTTTAYLLLGLLSSREMSAYELAEQVGRGVDQVWPRADRQRYNAPKRLVELGLVDSRIEMTGRRKRTVYTITDDGRTALRAWMATEAHPSALEFEGMVRVLLADDGSVDDLRANLRHMVDHATRSREMFAEHAGFILDTGGTFPERSHLFALANDFMVGHFTHVIEWATWALDHIEPWPDTASPAAGDAERTRRIFEASARYRAEPPDDPA
jgi:PadR family transcriptional regulator, regulatory protein AphA